MDNKNVDIDTNIQTIDLSKKFRYHIAKDKYGSYYYIQVGKSQRKARWGKQFNQQQALTNIENVRQHLLREHYPSAFIFDDKT